MTHRDHAVCISDPSFPERLTQLPDSPRRLFVRGALPDRDRAIAIVGARAASVEAVSLTREIARELAADGWLVVSGGAVGVDTAAHRGALDAGGATIAVLGCGVDVGYPEQNQPLFAEICASGGGLVSPFAAGMPPRGGHFVRRNRVIAALADAVLVIDASARSGALHTARAATEYDRVLGARPGTAGCDSLIARGAAVVESAADLVRAAGGNPRRPRLALPPRGSDEARVLAALDPRTPATEDEISAQTGLQIRLVLGTLTRLKLQGLAIGLPGRQYLRIPESAIGGRNEDTSTYNACE